MSKNYNRAKFDKAQTNEEYKKISSKWYWPPYYDEGHSYYFPSLGPSWAKKWHKKSILRYQYREYRTWKYNRKTRWK